MFSHRPCNKMTSECTNSSQKKDDIKYWKTPTGFLYLKDTTAAIGINPDLGCKDSDLKVAFGFSQHQLDAQIIKLKTCWKCSWLWRRSSSRATVHRSLLDRIVWITTVPPEPFIGGEFLCGAEMVGAAMVVEIWWSGHEAAKRGGGAKKSEAML